MAKRLMPISGIDNVSRDDELEKGGDSPQFYLKDAVNVNVSKSGRVSLRKGASQVTPVKFKNLWQSTLHNDVFATLERQIVKVNPITWDYEVLKSGVNDTIVKYQIVNNKIFISTLDGIFTYNGSLLSSLTIDTPASPMAAFNPQGGRLGSGDYTVGISYLRGDIESGISEHVKCAGEIDGAGDPLQGSISVTFPYCLDETVTHVVLYVTSRNGTELRKYETYPITTYEATIDNVDNLGRSAQFASLSPMPSGKYLKYWQGRLLSVDKNIIRFSQPLAYHLHDERYDFVLLPQRITFIEPVDNGIWVGQVDNVVFLSGIEPKDMRFVKKAASPPIPNTAIEIDADSTNGDISQGGGKSILWLAANGYVIGTSSGQIIEIHSGEIQGIAAKSGMGVRLGRRITTIVN